MRSKLNFIISLFALLTILIFIASPMSLAQSGQALVVDPTVDALFGVDLSPGPTFGDRTLISDLNNPAQGPIGFAARGVACESPRTALVMDDSGGTNGDGALFRVDLTSGNRITISDFGNPAQGPTGIRPIDVILDGQGSALVVDTIAGTNGDGVLFRVDLNTGDRTEISDFGDPAQGTIGNDPRSVALYTSGNVIVADESAGLAGDGVLFLVNLATGDRTVITEFADPAQGAVGHDPFDVIIGPSGDALVISDDSGTNGDGALFSVDLTPGPTFGDRVIISDFGDATQGVIGGDPVALALDGDGNAMVTDEDEGTDDLGALYRVDLTPGPTLGDRILISNFGDPAQGPLGREPQGVAFKPQFARNVPAISTWGIITITVALGVIGLFAVRRRKAAL